MVVGCSITGSSSEAQFSRNRQQLASYGQNNNNKYPVSAKQKIPDDDQMVLDRNLVTIIKFRTSKMIPQL